MKIHFSADHPATGTLVVPVFEDHLEGPALSALDTATSGAVMRAARAASFTGKGGSSVSVPGPEGMADAIIVLLGLGKADSAKPDLAVSLGGKAVAQAGRDTEAVAVLAEGLTVPGLDEATLASQIGLGAILRSYSFDTYRKKTAKDVETKLDAVTVVTPQADAASALANDAKALAEGVAVARDLVSEPPNILYPESFAERCRELEAIGVKVTVLDVPAMTKLGMGSLLGVGQGSVRESRLAVMEWMGGAEGDAPVAFVGKGVTFDTGGISLKPAPGMEDMKFDMGGAAAVTGALHALAARKAKANVVGLIGLVENMPGANAQRPSDIVTSMSGQTIEVLNTDAEGRLVLADVLTYAQETYSPKTIIDLATLTGAILVALASEYAGMFTTDDDLAASIDKAGKTSGEPVWRMPLGKAHDDMIKSDVADMKNIGGRDGGSSSAAAFLARFVEDDVSWAHLDIAGMAWMKKNADHCPKGATGYGVRLLDQFIRDTIEG